MRKVSIQFECGHIIGTGGIFFGNEKAKIFMAGTSTNVRLPFSTDLVPAYSFIATTSLCVLSFIRVILCRSAFPQVPTTVIECIVIAMIAFFSLCAAENLAMHINGWMWTSGAKRFSSRIKICAPVPLREPVEIGGIDNGILSLSQRDQSYTWIRWLGNRVPLNSVLWHVLTSNENVLPNHHSTLEAVCS